MKTINYNYIFNIGQMFKHLTPQLERYIYTKFDISHPENIRIENEEVMFSHTVNEACHCHPEYHTYEKSFLIKDLVEYLDAEYARCYPNSTEGELEYIKDDLYQTLSSEYGIWKENLY